tara:strand:+ start:1334 stop:1996 length:663 start_codon:yes stop_codon:yes gene_type:complete
MAGKKGNHVERRKNILSYLNMTGGFGISSSVIRGLSKKFGVSERQIYKDIEKVIQDVAMPEIEKLSKKFALSFEINMRMAHKLIISQDQNIQAKGISLLNQTISSFTDFLEKFRLKERVAEILELSEGGVNKETFEVYRELAEKYLKSFDERREDEEKLKEILKDKLGEELFEDIFKEIEEKIFHMKEIVDMVAMRDKDGIIERLISITCPYYKEVEEDK